MNKIVTVQGLQFGSEAKGNIASLIANKWKPDTVATAWGPNAGHTAYVPDKKFVHTMLAVGALAPSVQTILIGPGTVLKINSLVEEITEATVPYNLLDGKRLIIHPQAMIWDERHSFEEQSLVSIGSTMKGTMAAAIDKMRRDPGQMKVAREHSRSVFNLLGEAVSLAGMSLSISEKQYDAAVDRSENMLLEGAQGFSLGIHTDFYPYCTYRDISTAQLLADCRIPFPKDGQLKTVGVCRTYPIRVANRKSKTNDEIYTSGGCYPDQQEIKWEEIGKEAELTTVTKLPRRLFTMSMNQLVASTRVMRPIYLALTFCDYICDVNSIPKSTYDSLDVPDTVVPIIRSIYMYTGVPVSLISFGPRAEDVYIVDDSTLDMKMIRIKDRLDFSEV